MKKFKIKKNKISLTFLLINMFLSFSRAQINNIVQLKILSATYSIPDTNIRSGMNVTLRNFVSDKSLQCFNYKKKDGTYVNWVAFENIIASTKEQQLNQLKIKDRPQKFSSLSHLQINKAKPLSSDYIFTIEKINGQPGEIIKSGDSITLKSMADFAKQIPYIGLKKAFMSTPAPLPFPIKRFFVHLDSKKSDPTCQWLIEGNIDDGGVISLKSKDQEKYLVDPIPPESRAALIKSIKSRTKFYIFTILPKQFGEFNIGIPINQKITTKQIKGIPIKDFLTGEIKNKQGLNDINDGINIEGEDFNKIFGDLEFNDQHSKTFKQLSVTYQLGNNIYKQNFLDPNPKIQIPTPEQLENAKKELNVTMQTQKDLSQSPLGLKKIPGTLTKVATNTGLTYGINVEQKLLFWNGTYFEEINSNNLKFKNLAIGADGIILLIGTDNKLYQKSGNQFIQITQNDFTDISLANQNNIWAILSNNKTYKINLKTGSLIPVGTKLFRQVSVGSDGTTFAIDNQSNLFRWMGGTNYQNNENWIPIPGQKLKQIIVANKNEIWGIEINNRKVFKLKNNYWAEVGPAKNISFLAIGGTGEIWALVPQVPPILGKLFIYCKTKNTISFQTPISLKSFTNKYLTLNANDTIEATTNWPDQWIFINYQNPQMRSSLKFTDKVILKNVSTNNYIKIAKNQSGDLSFVAMPKTASIFELINHVNPQDTSELQKDIENSVDLKTSDGFLAIKKTDGSLFLDIKSGIKTKWKIECL
ncbi:tectonin domain-containing protein [Candidatus Dependentiae bacterium]